MDHEIEKLSGVTSNSKSNGRSKPRLNTFSVALVVAIAGSLAANILVLTFFGIPIAVGWQIGLAWICLAWSVLGAGSLFSRNIVAFCVWAVGVLPMIPLAVIYQEQWVGEAYPLWVAVLALMPSYVAFWCYRFCCGHFYLVDATIRKDLAARQFGLKNLFRWISVCAIALVVLQGVTKVFVEGHAAEALMFSVASVPALFLIPMIPLACNWRQKSNLGQAFQYLIVLCGVIVFVSLLGVLVGIGDFQTVILVSMMGMLIYFSAGGSILIGLSVLRD